MLISVSTFSQTTLKDITANPKVITDSTGITFMAFNEEQVIAIIKELKAANINKKVIAELEKQVALLKTNNRLLMNERDTLKQQIQTYIELKINLEGQVQVKESIITNLNKNIEDYKQIETNLKAEIDVYKQKIKRKNGWIVKLVATNVVTVVLLILVITSAN